MDFIEYQISAAILWAAFYIFYRLLLSRDTFHRFNRILLLCSMLAALVLPLCHINITETVLVPLGETPAAVETSENVAEGTTGILPIVLISVWAAGALGTVIWVLASIAGVVRIIRGGWLVESDGEAKVIATNREISPFSWMKYIVMSEKDWAEEHEEILTHEKAHVRLKHSWDLLFADLFTAFQWYNPTAWMMRRDLRELHEFEADDAVLRSGINIRNYQLLLVKKAVVAGGYSVSNNFNHSSLKSRITMMQSKKSSAAKALKALYVLPLVALSLGLSAKTTYNYEYAPESVQADTTKVRTVVTGKDVEVYIDGKKADQAALKALPSDKVKAMNVDKSGDKTKVYVTTTASDGSTATSETTTTVSTEGNEVKTEVKATVVSTDKNAKIIMDGKKADEAALKTLPSDKVKSINVNKKGNKTIIEVSTKGDASDADIYVDGKKVSKKELDKVDKGSIDSIVINKTNDETTINVKTKQK